MPDQAGINVVCSGKILLLPVQWNFQVHNLQQPKQWLEPSIIHYSGESKPWIHSDVPFAAIYLYHRGQTPFATKPPRTARRSKLRRALNLLIGRRKYWSQLIIARRCRSFASTYVTRIAADGAHSGGRVS